MSKELQGVYDPYAGPHPAGYGAAVPVEYDSFFAPHYTEQYPNGDFLYVSSTSHCRQFTLCYTIQVLGLCDVIA